MDVAETIEEETVTEQETKERGGYVPSVTLVLVITAGLCGLVFLPSLEGAPPAWMLFFGRFHVAMIHAPIGLVAGLAAVEIANAVLRRTDLKPAIWVLLWLSFLGSVLALALGTLLAMPGGYAADLLWWHRIWGTAITVLLFWTLTLRLRYRGKGGGLFQVLSYLCLVVAVAASAPAGHYGGALTHGADYLTKYMPGGLRSVVGLEEAVADPAPSETGAVAPVSQPSTPEPNTSEAPVGADPASELAFADRVLPILDRYCVSCHGPEKQKSDLRVDSVAELLDGGYEGPSIEPSNADQSLLVEYMRLPETDDLHMPPDGKPQPAGEEIDLIAAWIQAGASESQTASALEAR